MIGSGTMGQGIAQVFAAGGYKTLLYDANPAGATAAKLNIEKGLTGLVQKGKVSISEKDATLANIQPVQHQQELVADLIIEAVVENLIVKQQLFQSLEAINRATTIFCTNTSSLSVTEIFLRCQHQDRCLGVHFFNPAHLMKLVELIAGMQTSDAVVRTVASLLQALGKTTVLAKDSPGFIVNRVARHYYLESLLALEQGAATASEIDSLLRATGFKMGAFELMDLIGVDVNLAVTTAVYNGFRQDPKYKPNAVQIKLVSDGFHGRKNGKGFYSYAK